MKKKKKKKKKKKRDEKWIFVSFGLYMINPSPKFVQVYIVLFLVNTRPKYVFLLDWYAFHVCKSWNQLPDPVSVFRWVSKPFFLAIKAYQFGEKYVAIMFFNSVLSTH